MNPVSHTSIGLDIANNVFQYAGLFRAGNFTWEASLKRREILSQFAQMPKTKSAIEACVTAHHWGRELQRLEHEVVPLPPH